MVLYTSQLPPVDHLAMHKAQTMPETGLCSDYTNNFNILAQHYSWKKSAKATLREVNWHKIPHYAEHFEKYGLPLEEVVTSENKDRVAQVDKIIDRINYEWIDARKVTNDEFEETLNELYVLVRGQEVF